MELDENVVRFSRNQRRRRCRRPPFMSAEGAIHWSSIPRARRCRCLAKSLRGLEVAKILAVSDLSRLHFAHGPRPLALLMRYRCHSPPRGHTHYCIRRLTAAPYRKLRPLRLTLASGATSYASRPACARAHAFYSGVFEIMYIDSPHQD